jgi:hypothetical protein
VGQTKAETPTPVWNSGLTALWPRDGLLVWSGGGNVNPYWWRTPLLDVAVPIGGLWRPWWGDSGRGRLLAFDVSDPAAPRFLADTDLTSTNGWWSFSEAFAVDGKVYLSHQASEFLEGVRYSWQPPPTPVITYDRDGTVVTSTPPVGVWVTRDYLDVVDYADPANPTVRKPVNIPGLLRGVARDGALLYTTGMHYDSDGKTDGAQYLDASAYDGVSASLVTSLRLADTWWGQLQAWDGVVFLGRSAEKSLESWTLADTGQFVPLGKRALAYQPDSLQKVGGVLTVQGGGQIELYNPAQPITLEPIGRGAVAGCVWPEPSLGDGAIDRGVWLPLRDYGVLAIPVGLQP